MNYLICVVKVETKDIHHISQFDDNVSAIKNNTLLDEVNISIVKQNTSLHLTFSIFTFTLYYRTYEYLNTIKDNQVKKNWITQLTIAMHI